MFVDAVLFLAVLRSNVSYTAGWSKVKAPTITSNGFNHVSSFSLACRRFYMLEKHRLVVLKKMRVRSTAAGLRVQYEGMLRSMTCRTTWKKIVSKQLNRNWSFRHKTRVLLKNGMRYSRCFILINSDCTVCLLKKLPVAFWCRKVSRS